MPNAPHPTPHTPRPTPHTHFDDKAERYQPLDQIAGMEGVQPVLQLEGLNGWLERICDVKDLGDGPL